MTEFHGGWIGRRIVPVIALAGLALAACGSTTSSGTRSSSTTSTVPPGTSTTASSAPTTAPTSGLSIAPYLPLWPFSTATDVQSWQQSYQSSGHQPWHLDAGTTALDFTKYFLGYGGINVVVSTTMNSTGAHVAVGYRPTSSVTSTAAVVHLVRWGTGSDVPWEVVGTDDTTFSLTTPAYGATVSSPFRVGGTITGVDENISVSVRQTSSSAAIGSFCCVPAGGTASPWSTTVTFTGATEPVLTVAAATGGHLQTVERFTVTGAVRLATG